MEFKEGDLFHYWWKDEFKPSSDPYWCMDQQCVFRDGVLYDTYNYSPFVDSYNKPYQIFHKDGFNRKFVRVIDPTRFNMEFIVNVDSLKEISKYEIRQYDKVFDFSYQKGGNPYWCVEKNASTSIEAMIKHKENEIKKKESELESMQWGINNMYRELADLIKEKMDANQRRIVA